MANRMYPKARQAFAAGDLDWDAHNFRVLLLKSSYVFDTAHDFLNDIAAGDRVGSLSSALTGKTNVDGTCDADDVTYTALSASGTIAAFALVRDTGVEATSHLVCYFDTVTAGLPFTPDGSDFVIKWPTAGIFTL